MLVTVSGPLPVLVKVTVFTALVVSTVWLPKVSEVGDRLTAGALVPVPVRLTICGLPTMLSATLIVPVKVPVAVGVNVTLIVQGAPARREGPQLLVWRKFVLAVIDVMVSVVVPELVNVTLCAGLVVPMVWEANVRLPGVSVTPEVTPVPSRLTSCGLPAALSVMERLAVIV